MAAATSTFTLGLVGWLGRWGRWRIGWRGTGRDYIWIFFWDYLDREDTKASLLSFIPQTFTNHGDEAAHPIFLPVGNLLVMISFPTLSSISYRTGLSGASWRSRYPPPMLRTRICSLLGHVFSCFPWPSLQRCS